MSDFRKPVETWVRRLPQNVGKKSPENCTIKIEIFPAHYWAFSWEPGSADFYPKVPLQSEAKQRYWETRYRIRVNGAWWCGRAKARIVTYTREEIFQRYFRA